MGTIPSELISDPPPSPPIFTLDALPAATLRPPNLSWLETGTEYAGLHTQYNSDSSTSANRMVQKVTATQEVFERPSICTTEKNRKLSENSCFKNVEQQQAKYKFSKVI